MSRTGVRTGGAARSGFTLVELLVSIGVIAVLLGVLVPALAGARRSARGVACMSNLRQMIAGVLMYTGDNDDQLPNASSYQEGDEEDAGPHASWFFELAPYFSSDVEAIARCPDDASPLWASAEGPGPGDPPERRSSYSTNSFLAGDLPGYARYQRLTALRSPSRIVFAAEAAEEGEYAATDHFHPELWLVDPAGQAEAQLALGRHAGGVNWPHLDAHVETLRLREVYRVDPVSKPGAIVWAENRFDPKAGR